MGNANSAAAAPALCAAMSSLALINLLDPQHGTGTTAAAQASALRSAVRACLPLAVAGGFLAFSASVAFLFRHLRRAGAVADAGGGNRRLPEHLTFTLCASAGLLQLLLSVAAGAAGHVDHGGAAHGLGIAALRALPAAATASFYLGIMLIIVGHIRAGGEGGGTGSGAVAAGEAPVGLLANMAVAAAAAVVFLMAAAICFI